MGNCCSYKTTGMCVVCMYECNTKICRCSFAHKECAQKLVNDTNHTCPICQQRFYTRFLQSVPQISKEERQTLIHWTKLRRIKLRCEYNDLKHWTRSIFPVINSFFGRYNMKPRNVMIAIETIMEDENTFVQHAMNCGLKRREVDEFLQKLYHLQENFTYLPLKTQVMVKHQLVKR